MTIKLALNIGTKIINLTQHPASAEQLAAGVVDLPAAQRARLLALLTFDLLPGHGEIEDRAVNIAALATFNGLADTGDDDHDNCIDDLFIDYAMIGGAPYLMSSLETSLKDAGIRPIYSFSKRESVEQPQADGSVTKTSVFRHVGFVLP